MKARYISFVSFLPHSYAKWVIPLCKVKPLHLNTSQFWPPCESDHSILNISFDSCTEINNKSYYIKFNFMQSLWNLTVYTRLWKLYFHISIKKITTPICEIKHIKHNAFCFFFSKIHLPSKDILGHKIKVVNKCHLKVLDSRNMCAKYKQSTLHTS